jgi:hypothetical protein
MRRELKNGGENEESSVEMTVDDEGSRLADYQKYSQDFGVLQFLISKPPKFEDLGLAAIDEGQFRMLNLLKNF